MAHGFGNNEQRYRCRDVLGVGHALGKTIAEEDQKIVRPVAYGSVLPSRLYS